MRLFLGIDTSTTATKALLIDGTGRVVAGASTQYPYATPRPLWSEQDPGLWWQAAAQSIRQVLAESRVDSTTIAGVGLAGQMHGLVLLDENGHPLRPAILWNDQRTGEQCDQIRARLGKERLIQITGNDALAGFTAPKILWVREHEPDVWASTRHILLPKDYLRYKLTGERTPHPDPLARGAFVGLTVRHNLPHLPCAVLEEVAFGLRDGFELMKSAGLASISQVRLTGGGAKSPLWRQILADIFRVAVVTVNTTEAAAYGAALLAATGAGAFPDAASACAAVIRFTGTDEPGPASEIYRDIYPIYCDLYPALRPSFNAIALAGN